MNRKNDLNTILIAIIIGLIIFNLFLGSSVLYLIIYILIILTALKLLIFRDANIISIKRIISLHEKRYSDKEHRYYRCPSCHKLLRIKSGKGVVEITCPSCQNQFTKRSYISYSNLRIIILVCLAIITGSSGALLQRVNGNVREEVISANQAKAPTSEKALIEKMSASTVAITTEKIQTNNSWFGQQVVSGAGSGVIYSSNGYIVTCAHVVDDATNIKVTTHDNKTYNASLVFSETNNDIAVLKIDATSLTAAIFADSSKIKQGAKVYAVGNPEGKFSNSVSKGIISATSRTIKVNLGNNSNNSVFNPNANSVSLEVIQTDAAVSPGNSGGALFDGNGNLIGIVSAKSSSTTSEGLGFAIPTNKVKEIIKKH